MFCFVLICYVYLNPAFDKEQGKSQCKCQSNNNECQNNQVYAGNQDKNKIKKTKEKREERSEEKEKQLAKIHAPIMYGANYSVQAHQTRC